MEKKYQKTSTKKQTQRGVTLFISVVIMGILLFIAFAVASITLKSALFATSGRDSQFAFYAAEAGIECAVYWDAKTDAFATSSSHTTTSITCASNPSISTGSQNPIFGTTTASRIGGGGSNPTSIFGFTLNQGASQLPYCAIVTVTKNTDMTTYIKSRGYNTCDNNNPRRIERGIEVTY